MILLLTAIPGWLFHSNKYFINLILQRYFYANLANLCTCIKEGKHPKRNIIFLRGFSFRWIFLFSNLKAMPAVSSPPKNRLRQNYIKRHFKSLIGKEFSGRFSTAKDHNILASASFTLTYKLLGWILVFQCRI